MVYCKIYKEVNADIETWHLFFHYLNFWSFIFDAEIKNKRRRNILETETQIK